MITHTNKSDIAERKSINHIDGIFNELPSQLIVFMTIKCLRLALPLSRVEKTTVLSKSLNIHQLYNYKVGLSRKNLRTKLMAIYTSWQHRPVTVGKVFPMEAKEVLRVKPGLRLNSKGDTFSKVECGYSP